MIEVPVTNNTEKFNSATNSLVPTTKETLSGKFKLIFGIFGVLSVVGIISLILKITTVGFETKSGWGYYAAIVSLLLGVFGTAPMVAIAPTIAKADWHRPVSRIATMFTLAGISTSILAIPLIFALPPLVVDGIRRRSIWFDANIYTPHVFFGIAVIGLFLIGLALLWVTSIPDLSMMRDHSSGWRQRLGKSLSRGFIGSERQWISLRARIGMMGTFYFMFLIFVHIIYSICFSLELVAGWKDAIYPMYHAATGIQSGVATVIIGLFLFRKYWNLEDHIGIDQFWALSKLMFATTIFWFYFFICAFMIFWYGKSAINEMTIAILVNGPYMPVFIGTLLLSFIVPWWIIIWNPVRYSPAMLSVVAAIVLIGSILDRIRLYVISWQVYSDEMIHKRYIPLDEIPENMIAPNLLDAGIFIGFISLGIFAILLTTRLIPVVSIWERHQSILLTRHIKFHRTEVYAVGKPD